MNLSLAKEEVDSPAGTWFCSDHIKLVALTLRQAVSDLEWRNQELMDIAKDMIEVVGKTCKCDSDFICIACRYRNAVNLWRIENERDNGCSGI